MRSLFIQSISQDLAQVWMDRDRESMLRFGGIREMENVASKIDVFQRQPRVSQPATCVETDHKRDAHPIRFLRKRLYNDSQVRVGDLSLFSNRLSIELEVTERVRRAISAPNRLGHDTAKHPDFINGSVLAGSGSPTSSFG